jgi:hypothetical protein
MAAGACGGDGAEKRCITRKEDQIMAKTNRSITVNTTKQRTRKGTRKSVTRQQVRRPNSATTAPTRARATLVTAPVRQSKKAEILALLERPAGAAIADLTGVTGWQVHSVRAALTGLRKEGREVLRDKDNAGVARYRVAAAG